MARPVKGSGRTGQSISVSLDAKSLLNKFDAEKKSTILSRTARYFEGLVSGISKLDSIDSELDEREQYFQSLKDKLSEAESELSKLEKYKEEVEHQQKIDQIRREELKKSRPPEWTEMGKGEIPDLELGERIRLTVNGNAIIGEFLGLSKDGKRVRFRRAFGEKSEFMVDAAVIEKVEIRGKPKREDDGE